MFVSSDEIAFSSAVRIKFFFFRAPFLLPTKKNFPFASSLEPTRKAWYVAGSIYHDG